MSILWFLDGHLEREYQMYKVLAWKQAAEEAFANRILEPYYFRSIGCVKAIECVSTVDTLYAYMLQDYTDQELFEKMEDMDKQSEEWLEVKAYANEFLPHFQKCRRLGWELTQLVEQNTTFYKIPGKTTDVFLRMAGSDVYQQFSVNGESLREGSLMDNFPSFPGNLLVETAIAFPSLETMVPVIEKNMWRFLAY